MCSSRRPASTSRAASTIRSPRATKRNPDRVRGFATLPLPDVEASLVELERIKDAPGVVGIGVGSNFDGVALDDRRLEPVWARIAELGLPVSEHPMLPTFAEHLPNYALPIRVGFPFDTTLCVTRMIYGGVFERHPKLSFIVAHTGSAFIGLLERLDHGFQLFHECREHITRPPSVFARENLYYDTCAFSKSFIEMAVGEIGIDRFMFGTDYPYIISDPSYIEALDLPARTRTRSSAAMRSGCFPSGWRCRTGGASFGHAGPPPAIDLRIKGIGGVRCQRPPIVAHPRDTGSRLQARNSTRRALGLCVAAEET